VLEGYNLKAACDSIWEIIQKADKFVQEKEPFKTVKSDPGKGKEQIKFLGGEVYRVAKMLEPVMPATARPSRSSSSPGACPKRAFR